MKLRDEDLNPQARELLTKMYEQRGYELPYHRIMGAFDHELLLMLNTTYSKLNFQTKHIDAKTRELVFIGMLSTAQEGVGLPIHFKRALEAGATEEEILEVIFLMTVCIGLPTVIFALESFEAFLKKEGRWER